jgi:hypothetical protein
MKRILPFAGNAPTVQQGETPAPPCQSVKAHPFMIA